MDSDLSLHKTNQIGELFFDYRSPTVYGLDLQVQDEAIRINDHDTIGLNPILKNKIIESYSNYQISPKLVQYIPGYFDVSRSKFFECPISIGYIQLRLITINAGRINTSDKHKITIDLVLYSNDLRCCRELSIYQELFTGGEWRSRISKIINAINLYIDLDKDINKINPKVFEPEFRKTYIEDDKLIRSINDLGFNYFQDQTGAPGKDTYLWNEVEITNFPTSNYLRQIIVSLLNKKFGGFYDQEKQLYNFRFDSDFSPCESRFGGKKPILFNEKKTKEIKDFVMLNLKEEVNPIIELIDHLVPPFSSSFERSGNEDVVLNG